MKMAGDWLEVKPHEIEQIRQVLDNHFKERPTLLPTDEPELQSPYAPTKSILIDFDGTICPFNWPKPPKPPFEGARDAINTLYDAGYRIVIFTARLWSGWERISGAMSAGASRIEVTDYLNKYGIKFHEISAEKRPCLFIVDDSALTAGPTFDWLEFLRLVAAGAGHRMVVTGQEEA